MESCIDSNTKGSSRNYGFVAISILMKFTHILKYIFCECLLVGGVERLGELGIVGEILGAVKFGIVNCSSRNQFKFGLIHLLLAC